MPILWHYQNALSGHAGGQVDLSLPKGCLAGCVKAQAGKLGVASSAGAPGRAAAATDVVVLQ